MTNKLEDQRFIAAEGDMLFYIQPASYESK